MIVRVNDQHRVRRLIVARHAKAEPFAPSDHARHLTERGVQSARDAGRYLREQALRPDFVVVSSAERTRETWRAMSTGWDLPQDAVRFDETVFTGSADVALEVLGAAPSDAATVMFVGHNPTAAYLCHLLDDGDGETEAVSGLLAGFPPGALAVLEVRVDWDRLGPETGRVVAFYVGRD